MSRKLALEGYESKVGFERINAWNDAQQAYLRSLIAELPDPAEFAAALTVDQIAALLTARWDKREPGWYVLPAAAKILRPAGLCEAGKNLPRYFLGGFGIKVLKEIRKDVA